MKIKPIAEQTSNPTPIIKPILTPPPPAPTPTPILTPPPPPPEPRYPSAAYKELAEYYELLVG